MLTAGQYSSTLQSTCTLAIVAKKALAMATIQHTWPCRATVTTRTNSLVVVSSAPGNARDFDKSTICPSSLMETPPMASSQLAGEAKSPCGTTGADPGELSGCARI